MCMGGYILATPHLSVCLSCFVQVYLGEGVGEVVIGGGGVGEGGGKGMRGERCKEVFLMFLGEKEDVGLRKGERESVLQRILCFIRWEHSDGQDFLTLSLNCA